MSTTVQKSSKSGGKSLFFHDLASPVSSYRGKFSGSGQSAAASSSSSLWRDNYRGGSDLPPPPPVFTLEDRADFSPEPGIPDYPMSPETKSDMRTPVREYRRDSLTPIRGKSEASSSYATTTVGGQQMQQTPASSNWWSPTRTTYEHSEKGTGSPVDGVVHPGALLTVPPPREVATPVSQSNNLPAGNLGDKEWVTVYGFWPGDTNLVLREFEKCGVILKHVMGPRGSNWMHILYQNQSDAQKALTKNGMQISGAIIVGVKPLDPIQRQILNEKLNNKGFMTLPPPSSSSELIQPRPATSPHYLQNNSSITQRSVAAIASPEKSFLSQVMEFILA